jgi:adenylate kinase family enzyme
MGVGKTTFVYELRKSYNINYVSIGEISRQKIADGDKKLEAMLGQASSWNLDIVKYLISEKIEDKTSLYLLDGVPRNISEALWLRSIAEERATGKLVVSLFADKAEIARRLSLRTDRKETAEVVNARNRYYRENYSKIIEILKPLIKTVVNIDLTAMTPAHAISKLEYEVSKLA